MKKALRLLSYVSAFSLMVALCFLLCLWLYALAEPESIPLGTTYEEFVLNVAEQARLGHLMRVEEGEIEIFVEGERYCYHILSVKERLGNALLSALSFDYGQAISVPSSVNGLLIPAIAPSLTGTGLVLIGATTPLLLPVPKKRLLYLWLSLAMLGASIGLSFLPTPYPRYGTLGLCIAFLLLAWRKEKKGNACKSLLLSSLGLTMLFFLGAIPTNGNDDIASLTWKGIFHQDNHLYAVSLFFSLFLLVGLLGLGLTMALYRFLDKQKEARSASE